MKDYYFQKGIYFTKYRNTLLKELFRKSIHLCSSFVTVVLYFNYGLTLFLLGFAIVAYTICELVRLNGAEVPFITKITEAAARKRDENKFVYGPLTLALGILFTILIWWPDFVACQIGIYALAFGDGFASLVGKFLGFARIPGTHGKTAAGSLACFFAVFVSSFLVCQNCFYALILAIAAMILEIFPLKDMDNILIPIVLGGIAHYMIVI